MLGGTVWNGRKRMASFFPVGGSCSPLSLSFLPRWLWRALALSFFLIYIYLLWLDLCSLVFGDWFPPVSTRFKTLAFAPVSCRLDAPLTQLLFFFSGHFYLWPLLPRAQPTPPTSRRFGIDSCFFFCCPFSRRLQREAPSLSLPPPPG